MVAIVERQLDFLSNYVNILFARGTDLSQFPVGGLLLHRCDLTLHVLHDHLNRTRPVADLVAFILDVVCWLQLVI